jgi:hypothetical protein
MDVQDDLEEDFCEEEEDDSAKLQRALPQSKRAHTESALKAYMWTKGDELFVAIHKVRGVQVRPGVSGDGTEIQLNFHYPGLRADDLGADLGRTLADATDLGVARDGIAIYRPYSSVLLRNPRFAETQPVNENLILFQFTIIRNTAKDVIYNEFRPM